jgi:hypothetical protein
LEPGEYFLDDNIPADKLKYIIEIGLAKGISNAPTQTGRVGPFGLGRLGGRMDTRTLPTIRLGCAVHPTRGHTAKVKDHKKTIKLKT